ncbi:hypothetical protein QR98_0029060, partial [Sarcoptes scabiei]
RTRDDLPNPLSASTIAIGAVITPARIFQSVNPMCTGSFVARFTPTGVPTPGLPVPTANGYNPCT